MLQQHGHETLHRAERRAVNHDGTVLLVVGAGERQVEALGQVVVHLDCTQLPLAADGVAHHEVELGTVERGLALHLSGFQALLCTGVDDGLLGKVPVLVAADVFGLVLRIAERNLSLVVLEIKSTEYVQNDVHHLQELLLDLVGRHEQVGVVLRESAHTGQSVQLTALLVTVNGTELGEAQRQVAVRAGRCLVNLAVMRAVHRLQQILLAFLRRVYGLERVLAVLGPVAGSDVQGLVSDMRSDYLQVTVLLLNLAEELLQAVAQRGALGQPQGQALAHHRREREQFHVAS